MPRDIEPTSSCTMVWNQTPPGAQAAPMFPLPQANSPGRSANLDSSVQPSHGSLIASTWLRIAAISSKAHCSLIFPSSATR